MAMLVVWTIGTVFTLGLRDDTSELNWVEAATVVFMYTLLWPMFLGNEIRDRIPRKKIGRKDENEGQTHGGK